MTADYAMPSMALQGDAGVTGNAGSWQERGGEMATGIGVDAAKPVHRAVGIDDGGRVVLDRAVEKNPAAIDECITDLRPLKGDVVIGIDVVGSFARFIEASLLAEGVALVHAPGIAVNRAGHCY